MSKFEKFSLGTFMRLRIVDLCEFCMLFKTVLWFLFCGEGGGVPVNDYPQDELS